MAMFVSPSQVSLGSWLVMFESSHLGGLVDPRRHPLVRTRVSYVNGAHCLPHTAKQLPPSSRLASEPAEGRCL